MRGGRRGIRLLRSSWEDGLFWERHQKYDHKKECYQKRPSVLVMKLGKIDFMHINVKSNHGCSFQGHKKFTKYCSQIHHIECFYSSIYSRHQARNTTPSHLLHDIKPNLSRFHLLTYSIYRNKATPRANRPPRVSASVGFMEVAAPVLVVVAALEVEEAVPEAALESVADAAISPEVPLETDVPARLTVASAARALKFASVRVALAFGLTLITMVIPFWQCLAWEQYSHMGVVLLTIMVYVGVSVAVAATAMKPE